MDSLWATTLLRHLLRNASGSASVDSAHASLSQDSPWPTTTSQENADDTSASTDQACLLGGVGVNRVGTPGADMGMLVQAQPEVLVHRLAANLQS